MRIPYYVVFNLYTNELQAFQLEGDHYTELTLDGPRLWIQGLQLGLGLWQGTYQDIKRQWLRWYDGTGNWVLTPTEREAQQTEQMRQQAEQAELLVEQERQRVGRLMEQLRSLGVEPDLNHD